MQQHDMPEAKPPASEPEVIPPGADWQRTSRIRLSAGQYHTTGVKITAIGPVGFALLVLLILILGLAGIALLLGAALMGVAVVGVLTVGGIVSSVLRRPFRR